MGTTPLLYFTMKLLLLLLCVTSCAPSRIRWQDAPAHHDYDHGPYVPAMGRMFEQWRVPDGSVQIFELHSEPAGDFIGYIRIDHNNQ